MKLLPYIHHRRSIRLRGYDYSQPGAYFVTTCTRDRECLFGKVVDGEMKPNEFRRLVAKCWQWLATQYLYVELDEWTVMPNHFHGIIIINGRGGSRTAPTTTTAIQTKPKPLGRLIGAFKTVSTKGINQLRGTAGVTVWQRNYYEHVIRDGASLRTVRQYIVNNPAHWELDQLYSSGAF